MLTVAAKYPTSVFTIDNAGAITVADGSQLNFESTPSYTLTVQVADDDGNTDTATVTINVFDNSDNSLSGFVYLDSDMDGEVDVDDLVTVIVNWGPCP